MPDEVPRPARTDFDIERIRRKPVLSGLINQDTTRTPRDTQTNPGHRPNRMFEQDNMGNHGLPLTRGA
jgi:hypothetical protein